MGKKRKLCGLVPALASAVAMMVSPGLGAQAAELPAAPAAPTTGGFQLMMAQDQYPDRVAQAEGCAQNVGKELFNDWAVWHDGAESLNVSGYTTVEFDVFIEDLDSLLTSGGELRVSVITTDGEQGTSHCSINPLLKEGKWMHIMLDLQTMEPAKVYWDSADLENIIRFQIKLQDPTNADFEGKFAVANFGVSNNEVVNEVRIVDKAFSIKETFTSPDIQIGGKDIVLPYRAYVPEAYDDTAEDNALLLYLHGMGEGGTDNARQISEPAEICRLLINNEKYQDRCVIIAPQCPSVDDTGLDGYFNWFNYDGNVPEYIQGAMALVEQYVEKYNVDPDRIYVSGVSMGGAGTWKALREYADVFAAGVPVCGTPFDNKWTEASGLPEDVDDWVSELKDMPIWAFHGAKDDVCLPDAHRMLFERFTAAGGKMKYTEIAEAGHDVTKWLSSEEDLFDWLFSQTRRGEVPVEPSVDPPVDPGSSTQTGVSSAVLPVILAMVSLAALFAAAFCLRVHLPIR